MLLNAPLHKRLERILTDIRAQGIRPRLLLHVCCAPCASYCLEYLSPYFDITVYYYNPNITDRAEYALRLDTLHALLRARHPDVGCIAAEQDAQAFYKAVAGYERAQEGGARCDLCFALRLDETARLARERGFDWFASTLSISPHKDAARLYEAGERAVARFGVRQLPNDFKKRGGYQRSIEICRELGLYRQTYCGCAYSRAADREHTE